MRCWVREGAREKLYCCCPNFFVLLKEKRIDVYVCRKVRCTALIGVKTRIAIRYLLWFTHNYNAKSRIRYSLTHSLTHLLTYLLTYSLTYFFKHPSTYHLTHLWLSIFFKKKNHFIFSKFYKNFQGKARNTLGWAKYARARTTERE